MIDIIDFNLHIPVLSAYKCIKSCSTLGIEHFVDSSGIHIHEFYTNIAYVVDYLAPDGDIQSITDPTDNSRHYVAHIREKLYSVSEYRDNQLKSLNL